VINGESGEIIAIHEEKGRVHDMEIFRRSKTYFAKSILSVADKGYQGLKVYHSNSLTPYKKPRGGVKLTEYQKWFNSQIGSYRSRIEHVNRRIKRFKILQLRYRNKQRKHLLRISLICGIYNYELKF